MKKHVKAPFIAGVLLTMAVWTHVDMILRTKKVCKIGSCCVCARERGGGYLRNLLLE